MVKRILKIPWNHWVSVEPRSYKHVERYNGKLNISRWTIQTYIPYWTRSKLYESSEIINYIQRCQVAPQENSGKLSSSQHDEFIEKIKDILKNNSINLFL